MNTLSATEKPHKVGVALSGGGALGFAHIGALQALEEYGIEPTAIAGTSMGAIIGAIYANGYSPEKILQIVKESKMYKLNKLLSIQSAFTNTGLSQHKALKETISRLIPHDHFDSLQREMTICVTNFDSGDPKYISTGDNLCQYIIASASIPSVFDVTIIDDTCYVDGGLTDNLPSRALVDKCTHIIGIDVIPFVKNNRQEKASSVAMKSLRLMIHKNSVLGRNACNWLIECHAHFQYHEFNFKEYMEIYQYGYKATVEYIKNHPELIQKCSKQTQS